MMSRGGEPDSVSRIRSMTGQTWLGQAVETFRLVEADNGTMPDASLKVLVEVDGQRYEISVRRFHA